MLTILSVFLLNYMLVCRKIVQVYLGKLPRIIYYHIWKWGDRNAYKDFLLL